MSGSFRLHNIFQIGDVRLHLHVDDWHGQDLSAKGRAKDIQGGYRVLMPSTRYQYDPLKVTINALLYNDGSYEESQFVQKLKSLEGLETDVIAYRQLGGAADVELCCQCFCCDCHLMWLHTFGRIINIKLSAQDFHEYRAAITLELQPTWTPLNRALFRWDHVGAIRTRTESLTEPYDEQIGSYPDCEGLFEGGDCFYWRRRSILSYGSLYDPALFTYLHIATDPATGFATDWNTTKANHYVTIRPEYWGMAPLSFYVFDTLASASGTAVITVTHPANIVNEVVSQTTIDITTVKILAFTAGIQIIDSDLLIVGDVTHQGLVVRNGEIVAYVTSAIARQGGNWAGMLEPGRNKVEVNPPLGGRWSMNHTFRSL